MIRSTRLDNGIRVVTESMPHVSSVAAGFWVGTGSRDESARLAGASHFLEHLLFKGTPTRTAAEIAESVDAVGGDMNAFTTKEYTAFYVRLLAESLDLGLDILSDVMWDPAFRPDEVEAERQVIMEEILMHSDEPSELVHDRLLEGLFPDHPLGRDVLGDEESIAAMQVDDIRSFHQHHYRPGNIVVAAAGQIVHDDVVEGVARRFCGDRGGEAPRRVAPGGTALPVVTTNRPTEQAHVVLGVPTFGRHDEDRFSLAVLDHVLGGGLSSRLFQEIRERRGLAYSVYSYRTSFDDAGVLAFYAGTAPGRAHEVLERMVGELRRFSSEGVTEREVAVAKGHIRGETALSLEDSAARMSRVARSELLHGEVIDVDDVLARIEAVTADDVDRVAARVLGVEPVLAVVGPFEADDFGPVDVRGVA
ncbi:MAG TPA: pitrilysin family protein [Acidimicrobiales bacterium]|nr:pitrilysin family protein [Acidimicrobiales bacterium]